MMDMSSRTSFKQWYYS